MNNRQRGLTLFGLVIVLILLGCIAVIGMKSAPAWIEYWNIRKVVSTMANQGDLAPGTPAVDVRKSFDRRAVIDDITSITGKDLEVSNGGSGLVVKFSYQRVVPIVGNTSLLFDFEGSTSGTRRAAPS